MPEAASKRQGDGLYPAFLKRGKETVSSEELWQLLNRQWESPLPDTSVMFPWLHGDTHELLPIKYVQEPHSPDFDRFNVTVIRSSIRDDRYIENSGLLKSSLEVSDILLPLNKDIELETVIRDLLKGCEYKVDDEEVLQLVADCAFFNTLPLLKTDPSHQVYNCSSNSVRNSFEKWKQPHTFRRFDLQPSLTFHLSKICIVYGMPVPCSCHRLINVLRRARKLAKLPDCQFKILRGEVDSKVWGTPPILVSSLEGKKGLCSEFDVATFKNWARDMFYTERLEVSKMSSATKVENIWCGNSTDAEMWKMAKYAEEIDDVQKEDGTPYYDPSKSIVKATDLKEGVLFNIPSKSNNWGVFVNCFESADLPPLQKVIDLIKSPTDGPVWLSFPSAGSIGLGNLNLDSIQTILNLCQLLEFYPNEKLIFSPDGYTETSFLLVAYLIFKLDKPLDEVIFDLHTKYNRPFFLFLVDIQVLAHLETLLREYSPNKPKNLDKAPLSINSETFSKIFFIKPPTDSPFLKCKGPLPSRILPHLYLGSLKHAQCPEMLRSLGIKNIVSVGESVSWCRPRAQTFNEETMTHSIHKVERSRSNSMQAVIRTSSSPNPASLSSPESMVNITEQDGFRVCHIDNLGDNGMDPMLHQLDMVLNFIDECYQKGEKVFVHCMVGVSRSATVCIAECMKRLECGLLKAYLYVRVRRLNIIIQPSLMFVYELLKWQELHKPNDPDVIWDWNMICHCICQLNSNYI